MDVRKFLSSNKKRTGLLLSAIVIVTGLIPLIIFNFCPDPTHSYTITPVILLTEDDVPIMTYVYNPLTATGNRPGVVIGHGFTENAHHMQLIAIELVKRGFVVVNIEFRGHGSSGGFLPSFMDPNMVQTIENDIMAAVQYLQSLGNIDKIGLLGHSMGAMTVLTTADDYTNLINATVVLGMSRDFSSGIRGALAGAETAEVNLSRVSNLLIANGLFEQMFSVDISLNFLRQYTNLTQVSLWQQYGSFAAGNACKAIAGGTEHLFEPLDLLIIHETVIWFELAFNGTISSPIILTSTLNILSFAITLMGVIAFCFVLILYLRDQIWKNQDWNDQKNLVQDASALKMVVYYILGTTIGFAGLFLPLSILLSTVLTISMGQFLYAQLIAVALGGILGYYLVNRKNESLGFSEIPTKMKELCTENYGRAMLFGVGAALIFTFSITAITTWSTITTVPTTREIGTIFGLVIMMFPWLFIKEFCLRSIQGQLKYKNRFKEYFSMVGIGILVDNALIIPLTILTWAKGPLIGFLALTLTVVMIFSIIQQILVTWIYMYSGRNILGSTMFLSIFYAWMMINFFPFGLPMIS
ncbi:MAG: alpha/beta hydrolase [Candidatus Helarchaeota archaeon]